MMDNPELWTDFCLQIRGVEDKVESFEDMAGVWHFTLNGVLEKSKWVRYKNKWFYVDDAGNMLTGYQLIGGLPYLLNPSKADMATYGALMVTTDLTPGKSCCTDFILEGVSRGGRCGGPTQILFFFFFRRHKGQQIFNPAFQRRAQLLQHKCIQPGNSIVTVVVDLAPVHLRLMSQLIPIHSFLLQ